MNAPTPIPFDELHRVAPDVAAPVAARLTATGLGILGTTRADGSARVSPIEISIQDGRLYVGSMPGSRKAEDLRRDPRCCVLTPVADKDDLQGEGKLFCVAVPIDDPADATRVLAAALPPGTDLDEFTGSPVFELRVTGAAWQHVDGDAWRTLSWSPGRGVRRRERVGPVGETTDVAG